MVQTDVDIIMKMWTIGRPTFYLFVSKNNKNNDDDDDDKQMNE